MGLIKSLFRKDKVKTKKMEIIDFEKLFILLGEFNKIDGKKISKIKQVNYLGGANPYKTKFSKKIIEITEFGYIERYRVPFEYTKDDLEKIKERMELQTNKSLDIEIFQTNKGAYFDIKVYSTKLKTKYDFELIRPKDKDKLKVTLGYGRLGLVEFIINKHIGLFGESGSGKSTLLKAILTQLVLNYSPNELHLYLSDNKGGTELNIYANTQHTKQFVKDKEGLINILNKLGEEAEKRYKLLFDMKLENISEYNKLHQDRKLPNILLVVEEFAGVYTDKNIKAMLQLALSQWRSIGIYILMTTQRPSAKIVDGDLKCNLGTIIGLKTLDSNNSKIVIDRYNLLNNLRGNGHGYLRYDGKLNEFQGFFINHTRVVDLIKHLEKKKEDKKKEDKPKKKSSNKKEGEVISLDFLNNL